MLLAADRRPPRQRARDQKADQFGLRLRQEVLERLAALDPDPERFDTALTQIVDEMGQPSGPARAIALGLRDEWLAVGTNPDLLEHWLGEALVSDDKKKGKRQRTSD